MEVDYNRLKKIVDNARFEYGEEFFFDGLCYLFFPAEFDDVDIQIHRSPIFIRPSDVANWDIYMGTNLIEVSFRKPVLLHEILEMAIYGSLPGNGLSNEEKIRKSHEVARKFDDKYANETLDEPTYERYCEFRKAWINGKLPVR